MNHLSTNQDLINYHINKLLTFLDHSNHSISELVGRFKTHMPDEIWESDTLLLINVQKNNVTLIHNRFKDNSPYPLLIREMLQKTISNKTLPYNEFEIIFTWNEETFFPIAIKSIAIKKCNNMHPCVEQYVKDHLKIYTETPIFMLSKDEKGDAHRYIEAGENIFLVPDLYMFFRHSFPAIKNCRFVNCYNMDAIDNVPYKDKIEKAFFAGSPTYSRSFNYNKFEKLTPEDPELDNLMRLKFKAISLRNPEILDVRIINLSDNYPIIWGRYENQSTKFFEEGFHIDARTPFKEHYKFKYLMSIDGHTSAWCRVPSILNSNSVLLKVDGTCVEWFYPAMKPYIHYIPSPDNEKGFIETFEFIKTHDNLLLEIIENAHQFANSFLTQDAIEDFTHQLIFEYANHYHEQPLILNHTAIVIPSADTCSSASDDTQVLQQDRHAKLMFISKNFLILPEIHLKKDAFIENHPIVFAHIAKTGGANIEYLAKALIQQKGLKDIGLYSDCENHPSVTIVTKGCLSGVKVLKKYSFDLNERPLVQLIIGHMPLPMYDYFKISVNYISIVRDPVDRALSLGNYLYQQNLIKREEIEKLLLEQEVDNLQTRWIAGEEYMNNECTEETFAQALKNIQEVFAIVAPIEGVDIALSLVAKYFGFSDIAMPKINVTGAKVITKENTELCQKLLERNHYDKKLYEYVKIHWESWKADHIESITDNISADKEYSVISPLFYSSMPAKIDEIHSMNLEQINLLGAGQEELIAHSW